jgi:hypothetical protein
MTGEINRDFYCSAGYDARFEFEDGDMCPMQLHLEPEDRDCKNCTCYHRKYPTPQQFKEEYGHEYPDNAAVYIRGYNTEREGLSGWTVIFYKYAKLNGLYLVGKQEQQIICACTPWGKPPDDWRPE